MKNNVRKNASARGKRTEKSFAKYLNKYRIPAVREERLNNYSVSKPDIIIENHPEFKIDTKSRGASALISTFEEEVESKYCKTTKDEPIMPVRIKHRKDYHVVIRGKFFAKLLSYWLGFATKEELDVL